PVLRVLAFPQDRAAPAGTCIDDDLMEVCPANALRNRRDVVARECRTQDRLQFVLARFALQLLGSLIRFALEILNLPPQVAELAFLFRILQPLLFSQPYLCFLD